MQQGVESILCSLAQNVHILAGGKDSCSSCIGATSGQWLPCCTAKAGIDFQTHCFGPSGVVLHCVGVIVLWSHSACVGLTSDALEPYLTCTQYVSKQILKCDRTNALSFQCKFFTGRVWLS